MHFGCFTLSVSDRLSRRSARAAPLLLAVLLVLTGCVPAAVETLPEATPSGITQTGNVPPAPRWRRSGVQGTGESAGPIARVGAAVALTGPAAMAGTAQRNGLKLAQDEINASRVLGQTRLEVIVEDDRSDREQAAAVFQKFIENSHVVGILGPTLSDTALAVDPIAQQAGVPVLAISNAAGGITQIGNFIFRDCLSESQLTPQTIKLVKARLKLRTAALLYLDTDPNRAGSHGFKSALQDARVKIVAEQTFQPDETDFSGQLAEIASSNPDALFVSAPTHAAAQILIQARRYGLASVPIVGSNAFNSTSVLRAAGDAAEGLIVGSAWSAANPSQRNQQFIQMYRARFNVDPDQFAAQAYTGVYLIALALKESRSASDPRALRDALARLRKVDTPLGAFSFTDARDADYSPMVQIVRNGRFELF
jgi:branched-chain amino acid transport system substrate-binding protein